MIQEKWNLLQLEYALKSKLREELRVLPWGDESTKVQTSLDATYTRIYELEKALGATLQGRGYLLANGNVLLPTFQELELTNSLGIRNSLLRA